MSALMSLEIFKAAPAERESHFYSDMLFIWSRENYNWWGIMMWRPMGSGGFHPKQSFWHQLGRLMIIFIYYGRLHFQKLDRPSQQQASLVSCKAGNLDLNYFQFTLETVSIRREDKRWTWGNWWLSKLKESKTLMEATQLTSLSEQSKK